MRSYTLYIPCPSSNGSAKGSDSHAWIEKLLKEQFGEFHKISGFHEGATRDFAYRGKIHAYSVVGDETQARPFFKQLKKQLQGQHRPEILIVEKAAPEPEGGLPGERI